MDRLLGLLDPHRHELVLFDINRLAAKSILLVSDPRALTTRVIGDNSLPFAVTLVTNENPESASVVARRQAPFSAEWSQTEPLGLAWPAGVISLSHVALPFPPDDPLYGRRPPDDADVLFLGQMAILGERGLLILPSDWLLRIRHNPFYAYLEARVLAWIDSAAWFWKRQHGIVNTRRAGRRGNPLRAVNDHRASSVASVPIRQRCCGDGFFGDSPSP